MKSYMYVVKSVIMYNPETYKMSINVGITIMYCQENN